MENVTGIVVDFIDGYSESINRKKGSLDMFWGEWVSVHCDKQRVVMYNPKSIRSISFIYEE
jgi:hypothetical protein